MDIFVRVVMFVLGAVLGSFACCQAWRLRYKELGKKKLPERSVCMSCGKRLSWKENVPIFSWLLQRGRCAKCGGKIGWAEIFSEVSLGVTMALMGFSGVRSVIMMVALTLLWILMIYDAKWRRLPTVILWSTVIVCVVYWVWGVVFGDVAPVGIFGAVGILAGIYYLLYKVSDGKLVGDGDWILGLAIAFFIGDWRMALGVLLVSNLLALFVMLPQQGNKKKRVFAFGPFMVIGMVMVVACRLFVGIF